MFWPSSAKATARLALVAILTVPALLAAAQAPRSAPANAPAPVTQPALTMTPVSISGLCSRVDIAPVVHIPVGKSTVMRPASPVTRILLGNPENARAARPAETPDKKKEENVKAPAIDTRPGVADVDVLLLAPTEIYLLGKTIGSTNVVIMDNRGTCTAFDVVVGMDTTALLSILGQLLPGEKDIRVTPAFDSIVLSGKVSDNEALTRVMDLTNAYVRAGDAGAARNQRIVNMMEVGAPQQVMLEVKVAEISKALIDKLGVQFFGTRTNGSWTYSLLADFLTGGNAVAGASKSLGSGLTFDAQKNDGLVKVLAEPTIMAISGQTGSFLAGGKIFIPVSSTNTNGIRETTLEEKEFGVSVKFTPTVLGSGRINLRVRNEVSELNREGIGIVASGFSGTAILPSFTSRKAETTVQLMDGQSFAIGGLIKNNTTTSVKAFPFLGELPVIGALFRSTEFQSDLSELVFVITPRLVKPLPPGYKLPTDGFVPPSREDLMLNGKLEGKPDRGQTAGRDPATLGGFDREKK